MIRSNFHTYIGALIVLAITLGPMTGCSTSGVSAHDDVRQALEMGKGKESYSTEPSRTRTIYYTGDYGAQKVGEPHYEYLHVDPEKPSSEDADNQGRKRTEDREMRR